MKKEPLLKCPSCDFTEEKLTAEFVSAGGIGHNVDAYTPHLSRSEISGEWIFVCGNCGMRVVFPGCNEKQSIERWDNLPRQL